MIKKYADKQYQNSK